MDINSESYEEILSAVRMYLATQQGIQISLKDLKEKERELRDYRDALVNVLEKRNCSYLVVDGYLIISRSNGEFDVQQTQVLTESAFDD